jgi:hypothetical protein
MIVRSSSFNKSNAGESLVENSQGSKGFFFVGSLGEEKTRGCPQGV